MDIRVHTDDAYRLRDGHGPALQSARFFNADNCIAPTNETYARNIISSQVVQPYTKKLDDGACDYDIARNAELKSENLNFYNRPADSSSFTNNALNNVYNTQDGTGPGLLLPNLNTLGNYNPNAYGAGDYDGSGLGGTGVANTYNEHAGSFETYVGPPRRNNKYLGIDSNATIGDYTKHNFGEFGGNDLSDPTHYGSPHSGLGYQQNMGVNHNAQLQNNGGMKSLQFRERYQQGQPKNGFFF